MNLTTRQWAKEQIGSVNLRDRRRTDRVVLMLARAAERPAGRVSQVFEDGAEQQGAYDLLESGHVDPDVLVRHVGNVTAKAASGLPFVFVPIDGSSLNLTDRAEKKGFGAVGSNARGAHGLKTMTALAVGPDGAPLGLLDQQCWAREKGPKRTPKEKKKSCIKRKAGAKETKWWLTTIDNVCARVTAAGTKAWMQLDREADNQDILLKLASTEHYFTVRGSWDRVVEQTGATKTYVRALLAKQSPRGAYDLRVPAGPGRAARVARMVVRAVRVTLRMKVKQTKKLRYLDVSLVHAVEEGTTPAGEKAIDWLLLTNAPIVSFEDCHRVVMGYAQRWRIEDFHKAWKSGLCNVEDMQLRSLRAARIWATMLAVVAVRAERLKHLSRTEPDALATVALSAVEIRALILLKREIKKRTETIPSSIPTLIQAVLWIAELGGYTGKSSGGPPGAITIGRGLERLLPAAKMLKILEREGGSDQ